MTDSRYLGNGQSPGPCLERPYSGDDIIAFVSSEVAPNFGRFIALPNYRGGPSKNCTHIITPATRHVDWKKFREDTPSSPDVIEAHTLNFRASFKFLRTPRWGVC